MAGAASFTLSADDYLAASRTSFARSMRWRLSRDLGAILLGSIPVAIDLYRWLSGAKPADSITFMSVLVTLLLMFIFLRRTIDFVTLPRRASDTYQRHKALSLPATYSWSEEGLSYASEAGDFRIAWPDMWRWTESGHAFLFYATGTAFYPVPKNALTEAQAADLRALAARLGPPRL